MIQPLSRLLTHPLPALGLRVYLAGVFIYASLGKIFFPAEFADNIASYLLIPAWLINPLAVFMPWLELVSGLLLLCGVRVRAAAMLISALLIMFIVAIVSALIRDTPIGCGCFHSIGEAVTWWTVLRDVVWLGMAVHIYRYDSLIHLDRLFALEPKELGL